MTFDTTNAKMDRSMNTSGPLLSLEAEQAVIARQGLPVTASGQQGEYIVMRSDVYDAMLGISPDEESETIAAIRRATAQLDAGQSRPAREFFEELRRKYEP